MKPIDLDAVKQAWKAESPVPTDSAALRPLETRLFSQVRGYGHAPGAGLDTRLRRAAALDLGLKAALLLVFVGTLVAFDASADHPVLSIAVNVVLVASLAVQWRVFCAIPKIDPGQSSALQMHRLLLGYYAAYARLSAFVQALSAPLFFVVGSSLYLFVKYGALPPPGPDDRIVFWTGSILAFLLGFVPLLRVLERQRRFLASNLIELECERLDPARVELHRTGSRRLAVVLAVLVLLGAVGFVVLALRTATG